MDKTIWKKILELMPNDDFIKLTTTCDIHVKGFRKITPENYKMVKQKLMVEALKNNNLKRISLLFDKKSELISIQDEDDVDFRSMSLEELFETYENGSELFEILASLHSSSNPEHKNLAIEFENQISMKNEQLDFKDCENDEKMEELPKDNVALEQLQKELDEARKEINSLDKKLTKSQQKNVEWQTRYTTLESEFNAAKRNWKEEKKELLKTKTTLQQEVITKQNLVKKADIQVEGLTNKIASQEKELVEKNAKISHLNAKLLNSNHHTNEQVVIQEHHTNPTIKMNIEKKKRIALIGNPKNKRIEENNNFDVNVFEVSDLEQAFESNAFETFDEIWLLTYKVPATKQKVVHQQMKKPIVDISTFINLRSKVEKG